MKLYIAIHKMDYDGGYVLGVYDTEDRAIGRLESYHAEWMYIPLEELIVEEITLGEDCELSI